MLWATLIATLVVLRLVGVALAADAIMYARTPQGSLAWALSLLLIPELSIWLYLVFGTRRFEGYVKARRRGRSTLDHTAVELLADLEPLAARTPGVGDVLDAAERLTGQPPTAGNRAELLIDGEATFTAMFEVITRARSYLLIAFYMIERDELGERFRRALLDAAERGVKVMVIYAGQASLNLPASVRREYDRAGVRYTPFVSRAGLRGWLGRLLPWRRLQLNFRNHRKIVVADGEVAMLGGLNVGDDYVGRSRDHRLRPWRDTHVKLTGPCVQSVQLAWLEDWASTTSQAPEGLRWVPAGKPDGPARVQIAATGPADRMESGALLLHALIAGATRRLWIATPYFVPDMGVIHALQLAALRGVDVRIIIPEGYDSKLVWLSAFSYYTQTLAAGVRVLRYQPGFMHQKVLLCDRVAAIGTANMDNRSMRINFEITALIDEPEFTRQIEAMLMRDMERCVPVAPGDFERRAWWFRLGAMTARLLAPIQ